jgi:small subunit ribosomal protein S17
MSDVQDVVTDSEITHEQQARQQKVGRVVSNKMDKTIVVAVDYVRRHPLYHKRITRTSKFHAHDENNTCQEGDLVRIEETRPLSKRKRWIVREIVERAVRV